MITSEVDVTMGIICFTVTDGGVAIPAFVAALAEFFAIPSVVVALSDCVVLSVVLGVLGYYTRGRVI